MYAAKLSARKQKDVDDARKELEERGIPYFYESSNCSFMVEMKTGKRFLYWPTQRKWRVEGGQIYYRCGGPKSFIEKYIEPENRWADKQIVKESDWVQGMMRRMD